MRIQQTSKPRLWSGLLAGAILTFVSQASAADYVAREIREINVISSAAPGVLNDRNQVAGHIRVGSELRPAILNLDDASVVVRSDVYAFGTSISNNGLLGGERIDFSVQNNPWQAVIFDPSGEVHPLSLPPPLTPYSDRYGVKSVAGVNDNGISLVFADSGGIEGLVCLGLDGSCRHFQPDPLPEGCYGSKPFALNDHNQAVGVACGGSYIWSPDNGMTAIPPIPGRGAISAKSINNHGTIVGSARASVQNAPFQIALWNERLEGRVLEGHADNVSYTPTDLNDAEIIVGTMRAGNGTGTPKGFIYRGGSFSSLDDLHDEELGVSLQGAISINNQGVIIAQGRDSAGVLRTFALLPRRDETGPTPDIRIQELEAALAAMEDRLESSQAELARTKGALDVCKKNKRKIETQSKQKLTTVRKKLNQCSVALGKAQANH